MRIYNYHWIVTEPPLPHYQWARDLEEFKHDMGVITSHDEIHFDDGWTSQYELGLPVVRQHGHRLIWFIAPSEIGKKDPITGRGRITKGQVIELSREYEIGSHSLRHTDLRKLSAVEVRAEMEKSVDILQGWIGKRVIRFLPPYEYHNQTVVEAAYDLRLIPVLHGSRITMLYTTRLDERGDHV